MWSGRFARGALNPPVNHDREQSEGRMRRSAPSSDKLSPRCGSDAAAAPCGSSTQGVKGAVRAEDPDDAVTAGDLAVERRERRRQPDHHGDGVLGKAVPDLLDLYAGAAKNGDRGFFPGS